MSGVFVVTGGSSGIGKSVAKLAGARGYIVVVGYHDRAEQGEEVAMAVREHGGRALALRVDVRDEANVVSFFNSIDEECGRVKVLVNSAGIAAEHRPVADMSGERIHNVFATNVLGSFLCAREAIRRMSTQQGGSGGVIINLSSRAAVLGSAGNYTDYAASKAAIDTFTLGLAKEVAADGIRVNAVRPGIIDTEIHAKTGHPQRPHELASTIPLGRPGTADEVAAAVLWLTSPEAGYCTGTVLDVSGGR